MQGEVAARGAGPLPIQVVFQGGGAKLCDLLAAAEAVQRLQRKPEEKITIKRLAGTSAGAIAACLLATGQDLAWVRERLKQIGPKHLAKINLMPKSKFLPQYVDIGKRIVKGTPLYAPQAFREFLAELFAFPGGATFDRISDLPIPVLVTATDMIHGEPHLFPRNSHIVDALFSSCALPFVFKTFVGTDRIVDGGILENLPAAGLRDDDALIIGFSFKRERAPATPTNCIAYGGALLSAAMTHSVERACIDLGANVHRIDTDITTFEFEKALATGLDERNHYGKIRGDCYNWLRNQIDLMLVPNANVTPVETPKTASGTADLMEIINKVYLSQFQKTPVRFQKAQLDIIAWPLLPKDNMHFKSANGIRHRVTFYPLTEKLHCLRLGLLSDGQNMVDGHVSCIVQDAKGRRIKTINVPITVPDKDREGPLKLKRALLFFFDPPLDPQEKEAAPYVLDLRDFMVGGFDPSTTPDGIVLSSDRTNVEQVEVIAHIPKDCGNMSQFSYPGDAGEPVIEGKRIEEAELVPAFGDSEGFVAYGWRGTNLHLGVSFGMMLAPARR